MAFNRVKDLRNQYNVKQEELANILGVSLGNYSKKEAGIINFSLIEAREISRYFNLSIEGIFFDSEVSKYETLKKDKMECVK